MLASFSWEKLGAAQGNCRERWRGAGPGRKPTPSSFLISPLFYSIHSSNAVRFPCGHFPFVWRSSFSRSPSPPASLCVFPLHWRAFRQRAGIWFRSPNFSGKTVYFSVRFPHFCHRFAVHFPYDCRPFSIIALPLDSAVLGASARKSQWFQKSSGSLPYVFHAFSVHLPYFFRMLLDRVEGPIFREAPSSLPASPVSPRSIPIIEGCLGTVAGAPGIKHFPAKDTLMGKRSRRGEDGWGLLNTPSPQPYSRRISVFHRNMLLFTDLAR